MQWSVDCYSSCCKTSVVHHVVVMGPCCGGWAMSCHIVRHKYTTRHHVSRVPTFDPPGLQDLATQYTYLIPETLQTSNVRHMASILWVSNYLTVALTLVSAAVHVTVSKRTYSTSWLHFSCTPLGDCCTHVGDADISSTAGKTGIGNMHRNDTSHTSEQSSRV